MIFPNQDPIMIGMMLGKLKGLGGTLFDEEPWLQYINPKGWLITNKEQAAAGVGFVWKFEFRDDLSEMHLFVSREGDMVKISGKLGTAGSFVYTDTIEDIETARQRQLMGYGDW